MKTRTIYHAIGKTAVEALLFVVAVGAAFGLAVGRPSLLALIGGAVVFAWRVWRNRTE